MTTKLLTTTSVRILIALSALLALGSGCLNADASAECIDADGDGSFAISASCSSGDDCDDSDASIHPNAIEVCSDAIDHNCDGETSCRGQGGDCVDNDDDGFGRGAGCSGPVDCNDANALIHPGATEICGDDVDENCDGRPESCSTSCIDNDGDGYGAQGGTEGCRNSGVDCDDSDKFRHPGASEVCNEVDDNCNETVDECPELAACAGDGLSARCVAGLGGRCADAGDCQEGLVCDLEMAQPLCKRSRDAECAETSECLSGLSCEPRGGTSTCQGSFCDTANCGGATPHCIEEAARCVACRTGQNDCTGGGDICVGQGFCTADLVLDDGGPISGAGSPSSYLVAISKAFAACYSRGKALKERMLCQQIRIEASLNVVLERKDLEKPYEDGHLDPYLSGAEIEALDKIWGKGLFAGRKIDYNRPLVSGDSGTCLWFKKSGTDEIVVDRCDNY